MLLRAANMLHLRLQTASTEFRGACSRDFPIVAWFDDLDYSATFLDPVGPIAAIVISAIIAGSIALGATDLSVAALQTATASTQHGALTRVVFFCRDGRAAIQRECKQAQKKKFSTHFSLRCGNQQAPT
jgi:hypothetical protein